MKTVFLDTSYIIALEAADDQNHKAALEHWLSIAASLPQLVTTSYVFGEIATYFNSRAQHAKAVEIGNKLIKSTSAQLIHVNEDLFFESWRYFEQHADKSYSLTDCGSFVIMNRLGIKSAFTFDRHFIQAGFEKFPR